MFVQVTGGLSSGSTRVGAGIFSTRPPDNTSGEIRSATVQVSSSTYATANTEDVFEVNIGDIRYSAAFSQTSWQKQLSNTLTFTIIQFLG